MAKCKRGQRHSLALPHPLSSLDGQCETFLQLYRLVLNAGQTRCPARGREPFHRLSHFPSTMSDRKRANVFGDDDPISPHDPKKPRGCVLLVSAVIPGAGRC